jgi:hypothetical protein
MNIIILVCMLINMDAIKPYIFSYVKTSNQGDSDPLGISVDSDFTVLLDISSPTHGIP